MTRTASRPAAGFTLVEVLVASLLFTLVVLGGVGVSTSALRSSSSSIDEQQEDLVSTRVHELLRNRLGTAGASTLAIPAVGGTEPLKEGVKYEELLFRQARGWSDGEIQYDPAFDQDPRSLLFEPETGELWLRDARREQRLARGLETAWFSLENRRLTLHLRFAPDAVRGGEAVTAERTLLLRAP